MNDDLKLGFRVRQALNQSAAQLDERVKYKLAGARQAALERQRQPVGVLSLAGAGHFATGLFPRQLRILISALALACGFVLSHYWVSFEQAAENEEIDSALLSDDLPPAALLDRGFQAWLDRSSQQLSQ